MAGTEGRIKITAGNVSEDAVLFLDASPCAKKLYEALPIEGRASLWGDEVYFAVPVDCELEPGAGAEVEAGALGYWPAGQAFCIFFGPTPASSGDAPVAAGPVNPIGKILGEPNSFSQVKNGETVVIERS